MIMVYFIKYRFNTYIFDFHYRQNLNPNHDWANVKEKKLDKVINHYRHVGWTGTFPAAAARYFYYLLLYCSIINITI